MPLILVALTLSVGPSVVLWIEFSNLLPAYPLVNLDLLIPLWVAASFRRAGTGLFMMMVAATMIVSVASLFFLLSPFALFLGQGAGTGFPWHALVTEYQFLVWIGLLVLSFVFVLYRQANRRTAVAALYVALCLCVGEWVHVAKWLPKVRYGEINLIGSTSYGVLRQQMTVREQPGSIRDDTSLSNQVIEWLGQHPGRSILFVVAESLGYARNDNARRWLDSALRGDLPAAYEVRQGNVPFRGATTSGELHQLCQTRRPYYALEPADVDNCLPRKARSLGLKTVAIHAYSGRVFARHHWWKKIGFDTRLFSDDLEAEYPKKCGEVLIGLCDTDLLREATRRLQLAPSFVYLLTLNTHLPIPSSRLDSAAEAECQRDGLATQPCTLMHMHQVFLAALGKAVGSFDAASAPLVVIVGDHAPPFVQADDRLAFAADKVPYWIAVPRD